MLMSGNDFFFFSLGKGLIESCVAKGIRGYIGKQWEYGSSIL